MQQTNNIGIAPDVLVTIGPRRLIEKVQKNIAEADGTITFVDSLAFRDAAFPDGGWRLSKLMSPVVSAAISEQTSTRYLVVLGPARLGVSSDEKGGYVPALVGAQSAKETTELSAAIIDLQTASLATHLHATAEGTFASATWIVVSAMKVPMTQTSAFNGLTEAIARTVGPDARVAILAAEGSAEPFIPLTE
jgi:hypothetical protein